MTTQRRETPEAPESRQAKAFRYALALLEERRKLHGPTNEIIIAGYIEELISAAASASVIAEWRQAALLPDRARRAIRERQKAGESEESIASDYRLPLEFVSYLVTWQLFPDVEGASVIAEMEHLKRYNLRIVEHHPREPLGRSIITEADMVEESDGLYVRFDALSGLLSRLQEKELR